MDFDPSGHQRDLIEVVQGLMRRPVQGEAVVPTASELQARLVAAGLQAVALSQTLGGAGSSRADAALVCFALAQQGGCAWERLRLAELSLAPGAIIEATAGGLQQTLAAAFLAGERCAWVHDEPASRFELDAVATQAWVEAGVWHLQGQKRACDGADDATTLFVSVQLASAGGMALLAMPPVTPMQRRVWPQGDAAVELVFCGALPGAVLVANTAVARCALAEAEQRRALGGCAAVMGRLQALVEATRLHVRSRCQFGQPLSAHQTVQHRLVDAWHRTQLALSLLWWTLGRLDSANRPTRHQLVAALESLVARVAAEVGEICLQLHGAAGVTDSLPAARLHRANMAQLATMRPPALLAELLATHLLMLPPDDAVAPFETFITEERRDD